MADGMIGAAPDQLRELAKPMNKSGAALAQASASLSSAIARARRTGPDSERFRRREGRNRPTKLAAATQTAVNAVSDGGQ